MKESKSNPLLVARMLRLSEGASIVVFLTGVVVLIGWLLDIPTLKSMLPTIVSMKANTAVCLALLGVSLWLLQTGRMDEAKHRAANICALIVALVGLLTLCEYLFGWELGIDQLLFKEPAGAFGTAIPGRMSVNAAANFLVLGIAVLFMDAETQGGQRPAQYLTLLASLVSLLALIGYAYGAVSLSGFGAYTRIALHTAVAFMVMCIGLLSARPERGPMAILVSEGAGGLLARRLLLAAITIPFVLGALILMGQRAGLYDTELCLSLIVLSNVIVFAVLSWWNAGSIERTDAQRKQAEESLRLANTQIIAAADALNVLAAASSQILASTTQVASGTAETAAAISETITTVEEVKQAAQLSSQKAKNVSDSAQHVALVSQTGQKAVEETAAVMRHIRDQMESIAQTIVRLSEQGQSIGGIIASVTDIADQSNLLAVNAAIEAARAGEQGKGFAVVAQEIKSLAEQSKQATAEVRNILNDVQKATSAAVMATEQGSKAVDAGVKQSAQAGEAIRALAESTGEAVQAAVQIVASSQQQVVGMDQIGTAMENINQAGAETAASMRQAEVSAQNLHELGQKLKRLVEQYQI